MHHVAQVVDDRAGVADDYDSPAGVRGHDLIHHRGHALGDALGLLGEAELVAVTELERDLEQSLVDAHVRGNRLRSLERAPRRACVHRGRVELTNARREPGRLTDAKRAERGIGIAVGHAFVAVAVADEPDLGVARNVDQVGGFQGAHSPGHPLRAALHP